jgi:2-iminobutanoate/2-iminopropanoate deaminase
LSQNADGAVQEHTSASMFRSAVGGNALIQSSLFASADTAPQAQLASGSAVLSMSRPLGSAVGRASLVALLGDRPAGTLAGFGRPGTIVIVTATITAAPDSLSPGGRAVSLNQLRPEPSQRPFPPGRQLFLALRQQKQRRKTLSDPDRGRRKLIDSVETVFIAACSVTRQASERAVPRERRRAGSCRALGEAGTGRPVEILTDADSPGPSVRARVRFARQNERGPHTGAVMINRQAVSTDQAPAALGPYSQAIVAGGFVFCSGTAGIDPATGAAPDGIDAQTDQALRNLAAVLASAGATMADVVKTTIFYTDVDDFGRLNETYSRHMPNPPPARSAPANVRLPRGLLISIDAIAVLPTPPT